MIEEENVEGSPEGFVDEKVCVERVKRIEAKIDSSSTAITASISQLSELIKSDITGQKEIVDKHGEQLDNLNAQVVGLLQWKINGEKKADVWYRRQAFVISMVVLAVGVLSNASKIVVAVKGLFIAWGGGSS